MPGFDWDRARADRLCAERGTEPVWGPGGPPRPSREPAPAPRRTAAIERWLSEFKSRSYEEQLGSLGRLRRDLTRLLGSDDTAAGVIREQFKPHLKLVRPTPPARAAAPPAPNGRPRPNPSDTMVSAMLRLLRRRPRQLTQEQCFHLLEGHATKALRRKGLTRDEQFGSFSPAARGKLKLAAKHLRARGIVAIAPDGLLYVYERRP